MSCYICDDDHISALAGYAVKFALFSLGNSATLTVRYPRATDAEALARDLRAENEKSFRARYQGRHEADWTAFRFNRQAAARWVSLSPVEVIKAAQCFDYQACEHDGYAASLARETIRRIIDHAIARLPGYADAPFGLPAAAANDNRKRAQ